MSSVTFYLLFFSALCITISNATDLNLGTTNGEPVYVQQVKLPSIPLKARTKTVFYSDKTNETIIKGIAAIDQANGEASAMVIAGGVGLTFVKIRLTSAVGEDLDYEVQIYV